MHIDRPAACTFYVQTSLSAAPRKYNEVWESEKITGQISARARLKNWGKITSSTRSKTSDFSWLLVGLESRCRTHACLCGLILLYFDKKKMLPPFLLALLLSCLCLDRALPMKRLGMSITGTTMRPMYEKRSGKGRKASDSLEVMEPAQNSR